MNNTQFVLVILAGLAVAMTASGSEQEHKKAHQQQLERGLLPAVVFDGEPAETWSLEQRMRRYRVPGVSIALINDGSIEWVDAYGQLSAADTPRLTPSTRFQSASISKWVTAIGALKLVEQKQLKLDQPINTHLQDWTLRNADGSANSKVTLRHLLSHQAGVSVRSFQGYSSTDVLPTASQILEGTAPANSAPIRVVHEPGSEYRYSGGGYQVVQQWIEEVSGQSFVRYMQNNVLRAAQMSHSSYHWSPQKQDGLPVACGHEFNGEPVPNCGRIYPELAAAWFWSTPADLARLAVAIIDSVKDKPDALLGSKIVREKLTSAIDHMGLGAGVHGTGQGLHFDHSGWTHGFRSYLVVYPYLGKGIVVMTNGNGGHELINEIVRSAAATYQWPDFAAKEQLLAPLSREQLEAFVGEYRVEPHGFNLKVSRIDNHLRLDTPRGSHYQFFPIATNRFIAIEDGVQLTFTDDAEVSKNKLRIWGMTATRIPAVNP